MGCETVRIYARGFDARGVNHCGTDGNAIVPSSLRTDRGRVAWAKRWLASPSHLPKLVSVRLEFCFRPYSEPFRVLEVKL